MPTQVAKFPKTIDFPIATIYRLTYPPATLRTAIKSRAILTIPILLACLRVSCVMQHDTHAITLYNALRATLNGGATLIHLRPRSFVLAHLRASQV